jgi:hypothetical protein
MDALLVVGLSCWLLVVILLLHHIYKHPELPYPDRIFQMSDVCNFDSWNHEMWVIFIFFGGLAFVITGFIETYV